MDWRTGWARAGAICLTASLLTACALLTGQRRDEAPLGSAANPVQAYGTRGQREYLARLRCRDGTAPAFGRLGTMGQGPDGHSVDRFLVQCPGNDAIYVHMDLFHTDYREPRPLPGFDIVADLPAVGQKECPPTVPYEGYTFLDIEVSRSARLVSEPPAPAPQNEVYALLEFVVGTDGAVEPDSVRVLDTSEERLRAAPALALKQFRFSAAEHPLGCRVRQRVNGLFVLDRSSLDAALEPASGSQ